MPRTQNRDLASAELWQESLDRSRRRRALAEDGRREMARRKTASFAVTAAVAAAPMWPTLGALGGGPSKDEVAKQARRLRREHVERILLKVGDTGPAVAELQRALGVPDDGIFGPQTRAAVRAFQERHNMRASGEVDLRTWLTLFPTDMVVYAPPHSVGALGANRSGVPEWTALSVPDAARPAAAIAAQSAATEAVDFEPNQAAGASDRRSAHAGGGHDAAQALGHLSSALGGVREPPSPSGGPGGVPGSVAPGAGSAAPSGGSLGPSGAVGVPLAGGGGGGESFPHFHFPRNATIRDLIAMMISAANRIDRHHYAYRWGGGHNASFNGPYDCSGAVSAVLHAAGLLTSPRVSGDFMHWGAAGPGAVTIFANAGHVYMSILGRFFGTTRANPGGGAGWFRGAPRPGFAVVHVPFSKLHVRKHRRHGSPHRRHRLGHRHAPAARTPVAPVGGSGGATAPPSAPATAPPPATAPAPTAPAPSAPAPSAPAPTAPPPSAPAVLNESQPTTSVQQTTAATPVESPAPAPTPESGSTAQAAAGGDTLSQLAESAPATSSTAPDTSGRATAQPPADASAQQATGPEQQAPQLAAGNEAGPTDGQAASAGGAAQAPASDPQQVPSGDEQGAPEPGRPQSPPPAQSGDGSQDWDENAGQGAVTPSAANDVQQSAGADSKGVTSPAGN